jgi:hypothetical protein
LDNLKRSLMTRLKSKDCDKSFYCKVKELPLKTLSLIVLLSLSIYSAHAQLGGATSYLSDFNGTPITASKANEEVKGSPYLNDLWASGQIFTEDNKKLDVERMRFNILLNRVEYDVNGRVYELVSPCHVFMIYLPTDDASVRMHMFRKGFPPIDKQNSKTYYEVVYNGKVKLLRLYQIRVTEHAEPLSLTSIRRYGKVSSLYVYHPEKNITIKAPKRITEMASLFDDKREEMEKFVQENEMKKSISEENLLRLCQYYNSLLK